MDEALVQKHAEAHAAAMVDGDLKRAGSDLAPEAQREAGAVMKRMPDPLHSARIEEVATDGASTVTQILYSGTGAQLVVRARWEEREGRPMIVSLAIA
jgi:hypothetical protein